jgi:hypothetical protein
MVPDFSITPFDTKPSTASTPQNNSNMSDSTKKNITLPTAPDASAPSQAYDASCHCGAFKYDPDWYHT